MSGIVLFNGLSWPIQYGTIKSIEDLMERLEEEAIELQNESIELPATEIKIYCEYLDSNDNQRIVQASLPIQNNLIDPKELLTFVHNSLIESLEDNDYHFLEGLLETERGFYNVLLGN